MVIQCEQCEKRFRLDPSLIKHSSVRVRCSSCQHVFRVDRPEPVYEEEWLSPAREMEIRPEEVEAPPRVRRRSRRTFIIVLVPLLLVVAGLALWQYLPSLLEPKPASKRSGVGQLHLVETRGYFIDNQHAGQLFVIEGRLRNEFPKARRWVHLRAKLYTIDGQAARQLDFYAGDLLTTQQLRSMSLKDLVGLIQQRPAVQDRGRSVAAQEEVSFTVPFGNLPDLTKLSDYSVEILASQPT